VGYRGKVAEQERGRELRAEGWTLAAIAAELDVSKGAVSGWVRDVPFSAPPRSPARRRGPNALQRAKAAEIESLLDLGRRVVGELDDRDLLIAGTALYAGEGAKTDGVVKFTNSDPQMVALFLQWLRRFFTPDESRLRLRLYLHQGLDLDAACRSWSSLTGIPVTQFQRPHRAVPDPSIRRSKHPMGCATVAYSCSRTHRAIMGLVQGLLPLTSHSGVAQLAEQTTVNR
jgi:transcriptional regulator with XRE-family HTH domain